MQPKNGGEKNPAEPKKNKNLRGFYSAMKTNSRAAVHPGQGAITPELSCRRSGVERNSDTSNLKNGEFRSVAGQQQRPAHLAASL